MHMTIKHEYSEQWYSKSWRPAVAFIYMAICVFDFALLPLYFAHINSGIVATHLADAALKFTPEQQMAALRQLHNMLAWQPVTLQAHGFFHGSMAALLGVAAYQRSQEKIAKMRTTKGKPDAKAS
jgi:hypothetical protein